LSNINVLHVIDNLGLGGCQSLLKAFFEKQQQNNSISLFSLRKVKQTIHVGHQNIVEAQSLSKFSISPIFQLLHLIKDLNISVLHCHLFRSQVFGLIVKLLFKPKLKIIFHEHGRVFGSENKFKFDDFIYIKFLKYFSFKVDCFISISKACSDKLVKRCHIKPEKIIVLYNFISDKFLNSNSRVVANESKFDKTENLFTIGFAGRLIKRKGWKTFLKAAKLLNEHGNISFIVAGNGPDRNELITLMKEYNLSNKIAYLGFVNDIINEFYKKINCLIIPSEWEPMGLVELEAQAIGIPVIASNVEGLNEIVIDNNNGLLFETNNFNELVAKILLIRNDKDLKNRLIENGFENCKNFNCNQYINKLDELYKSLGNARFKQ
jgi:L-malate glycosyltransferase